ncbi:MAG: hypothetical protein U0105_01120 [Candidatus Obscuribacterales bacterium]
MSKANDWESARKPTVQKSTKDVVTRNTDQARQHKQAELNGEGPNDSEVVTHELRERENGEKTKQDSTTEVAGETCETGDRGAKSLKQRVKRKTNH